MMMHVKGYDRKVEGKRAAETLLIDSGHRNIEENDTFTTLISRSQLFLEFKESFTEATGLALALRPPNLVRGLFHTEPTANPFCRLMEKNRQSCQTCAASQRTMVKKAMQFSRTQECWAGLCETLVPIKNDIGVIGFLQTGQVMLRKPCKEGFERLMSKLAQMNVSASRRQIKKCFYGTRHISRKRYRSIIRLLEMFALHLAMASDQLMLDARVREPQAVARAKDFIKEHYHQKLTLCQVAQAVHVSSGYFSEIFKKYTGVGFVEYVNRSRVAKAKQLLTVSELRISEIAFDVGFQSLSQFNRSFTRFAGSSPTHFRIKHVKTSIANSPNRMPKGRYYQSG